MPVLAPDKLKIGDVILVATRKPAVRAVQQRAGYGESSRWTHVAGCLGGRTAIEASLPRSRLVDPQKAYVDRGCSIKVMRRRSQTQQQRYKVALWWATMNNLPYDTLQFFWFPLSVACGRLGTFLHGLFSSRKRFLCSELIATGLYKEGDYVFGRPAESVFPADFDNPLYFDQVHDIWEKR